MSEKKRKAESDAQVAHESALAAMIDHTILKSDCKQSDIERVCNEALQYNFASVCIPPYWAATAKSLLSANGETAVKVAIVIGFPFGYSSNSAKVAEVCDGLSVGVDEIDMVANICAIKNGDWTYLEEEISDILEAKKGAPNVALKVIIESGILTDEEIIKCCEIYGSTSITFLKTSTGYAERGASVHAVELFRKHLPSHIQIKASGGIRTRADALAMVEAGATRLGCSASVAIVSETKKAAKDVADTGY